MRSEVGQSKVLRHRRFAALAGPVVDVESDLGAFRRVERQADEGGGVLTIAVEPRTAILQARRFEVARELEVLPVVERAREDQPEAATAH